MNKKITAIFFTLCLTIVSFGMVNAHENNSAFTKKNENFGMVDYRQGYGTQWEMNYGSNPSYGARYEGPQPIGDCDNDGDNELLIGGRDAVLRVMEWNRDKQTYEQTHSLHCPFYPLRRLDADGFAIGDLTGNGENEIAVSWYADDDKRAQRVGYYTRHPEMAGGHGAELFTRDSRGNDRHGNRSKQFCYYRISCCDGNKSSYHLTGRNSNSARRKYRNLYNWLAGFTSIISGSTPGCHRPDHHQYRWRSYILTVFNTVYDIDIQHIFEPSPTNCQCSHAIQRCHKCRALSVHKHHNKAE